MLQVPATEAPVNALEAISLLRDILALAYAGDLTGFAIAYTGPDGHYGSAWTNTEYLPLLGAIQVMQAELVQGCIEAGEY